MAADGTYRERVFHAQDDVPIYFRDYGDPNSAAAPVLCLTGLTRNSKDFHPLAQHLCGRRRVLAMDYRGRGRSGYDRNFLNYHPRNYVSDAIQLLAVAGVHKVVVLGTSLGGICAMGIGIAMPTALTGVILNDIGPVVATEGRARIANYVGNDLRLPDYDAAARALRKQFSPAYPDTGEAHWRHMAECIFAPDPVAGNLRLDYDLRVADALRAQAEDDPVDLWPLFRSLGRIPVLAVRGALSDILDQATFDRMASEMPAMKQLVVPNRGHVPLPEEEPFASAIDDFLAAL